MFLLVRSQENVRVVWEVAWVGVELDVGRDFNAVKLNHLKRPIIELFKSPWRPLYFGESI